MKTYDPNKPLISIHIPKSGGSSFRKVLKTWFKGKYLGHYHNEKKNKPPKKHNLYRGFLSKRLRPGLCIHGHFNNNRGNGIRDYYPEIDQLITIIRDPFDLHLSNYFYVRRLQSEGMGAWRSGQRNQIIKNGWNLVEYLINVNKSYICNFLPFDITLENYQEVLETQFIYIGILEQLQKSVDILAQKLGFSGIVVPQVNVSEWTETIPNGAREEFEFNNPLEMSIYRYAKDHWGNKI
jgi:hypothetical protein